MQTGKLCQHDSLAANLSDITSFVKCPICLQFLKNPVELRCNHMFCIQCIERHSKGNNYNCPLCKASVLRRSAQPAFETEGALKLLENVCKKFKEATASTNIKKNTLEPNPEKIAPRRSKVKSKSTAAVKNLQKNPPEAIVKVPELKPKRSIQKAKKAEDKAEKDVVIQSTETKQQKAKHEQNKKLMVQISKQDQNMAPYKESVMEWLYNSQNRFERHTQTQQGATDLTGSSKHPKNLKSISQRGVQRRTMPARQAAGRKDQRMCRSMESLQDQPTVTAATVLPKTKVGKLKVDLRIFDSPVDESELLEHRIEDIDSHPNPVITKSTICRLAAEEDCLETIVRNAARRKSGRKRKKSEEKTKDDLDGLDKSMRSDWQRIAKISHKVDRIEGIPKKLKLVTTPPGGVSALNDKGKGKENVCDTQFSTTEASQYGRVLDEFAQNVDEGRTKEKAKKSLNVHKITLNEIMKEIEVSKRKRPITTTAQPSQTAAPAINIDYNEHHHKTPLEDDAIFQQNTQRVNEEIIEATPTPNATPVQDDIFSYATQPTKTHANEETLHTQCEEFLTQFSDLNHRLSTFVNVNSSNCGGDDSYSKLVLVHRHLQTLQPKFHNISHILSRNEGTTTTLLQTIADQSTQTDVVTDVNVEKHKERKDVDVQTVNKMQTKCLSPIFFSAKMREHAVQTSPIMAAAASPSPKKLPVVHEELMKDTLDFVDFDTQAAIQQEDARKKELAKLQTLTERQTEQMQLTAFIEGVQLDDAATTSVPCVPSAPNPRTDNKENETAAMRKSTRRKLYKSPLSLSQSPLGIVSKRIKPLIISDSEEEDGGPIFNKFIREDISVCMDSESVVGQNEFNSPNVDKYLDDVWSRLQNQLDSSKGKYEPEREESKSEKYALQMAIKANTQDLIAKCEQLMSNTLNETQHPNSQVSLQNPAVEHVHQDSLQRKSKISVVTNPNQVVSTLSSGNLMTDSIFGDVDDELFENFATPSPCTSSRDKPKSTLHNLHSDLIYKDSNSSILTNILDENPLQVTAVRVLQDVQISKPEQLKSALHTVSDDELIFSTPETTPTKPRKPESPCEPVLLPPPPDFDDDHQHHQHDEPPLPVPIEEKEKHRSNILSVTHGSLNLSPIQASGSRSRHIFNTSIPRSLPHHAKATTLIAEPFRRVTSTPYSKSKSISSIPISTPRTVGKVKVVNSALCHAKNRNSQLPITNFLRKEGLGGGATSLNVSSDDDDIFVRSASRKMQAVVACTRLDKTQMIAINALAKKGLARYSSTFDASVTHMVVATNESNCAEDHTIKYVRAVAAGIWVVNCKWVQDSLLQKSLLPEEFYEVYDVLGQDGPKQSRMYRTLRPLFDRFKMYVAPPFELITPSEVEDIITSLGGIAVSSPQALLPKQDFICVIIAETVVTQDEEFIKYHEWAENLRVATVDFEWLTRSIGAYKLNSLRRFALCTDEILCELGYPEHLLESVQFTFTEND